MFFYIRIWVCEEDDTKKAYHVTLEVKGWKVVSEVGGKSTIAGI